jgi:hypothetical protein
MSRKNRSHNRTRRAAWCVALLVIVGIAGCAHAAKETAKEASQTAAQTGVQATVSAMSDPRTRKAIGELLNDPEIQASARELAANVSQGAVMGLTQEEQMARIEEFSRRYVTALSSALVEGLGPNLSREAAAIAAASTDAAMRAVLSDRHRAEMEGLSAAMARAGARAMAEGIRDDIGPAVRDVLARDVGPGLGGMLNDGQLSRALERTSDRVTRAVVLGARQAVPTSASSLTFLGLSLNVVGLMLIASALGFFVAIGLLVWSLRLRRQLRREHEEAQRSEASVLLLARAIKATEHKPWSPELQETLRETARDDDAGEYVRETLRKHKELRLGGIDQGVGH